MPVTYGTDGHDLIEGTAGGDILVGGAGSDTYVVNDVRDLIIELGDPEGPQGLPWWGTTAAEPITLVRTAADEFWVRIQIAGAPDGVFAEFRLEDVSAGVLGITGLRIADTAGQLPVAVLADGDSVWEYAFQLGRPNADGSPTHFEWYGGGHGFEQLQALGLMLDGVDFTDLPIGRPVNGRALTVAQDLDIVLPSDGVTPAGSVVLQHVFDQSGLSVRHAHDYLEGFELARAYSAMLPVTGAGRGGIDFMQIGDGPIHQIRYDGSSYLETGTPSYATAWGASHGFQLTMTLPSGGPDENGDWSRAEQWGMWLYDTAVDYSKIYVNWLEGGRFTYPATDSAHLTHYAVSMRDPGAAAGVTPLGPRQASQGVDTIVSSISLALPDNVEILRLTGSANLSGSGNRLNNTILGNEGDNILDGGGGTDLLYGGAGNDTYLLRSAGDYVGERAGEGVDLVLSFAPVAVLTAHVENIIYLGREAFTGTGNASANRIEGNLAADVLRGLDGDDELIGQAGDDTLVGGAGHDQLVGGTGVNTLLGDEGNDILNGIGGRGVLQGGTGDDVYLVDDRASSIVEMAGEGTDEIRTTLLSFMAATEVENLTFTGTGGFTGTGNASANRIVGGAGGDLLNGLAGNDHLVGLAGADLLIGGAGDNVLDGGDGVDTAYYVSDPAGIAVDLTTGVAANAFGGTDTLIGIENAFGTARDDTLIGSSVANVLNGGDGTDFLVGGAGGDALLGGNGLDTASYASAATGVDVRLHLGVARNDGHGGVDTLGGIENLIGSALNDLLTGEGGANILRGEAGADTLLGFGGDDVLAGGAGALNTLQGGTGDDLYVVEAADTIVEAAGEGVDSVQSHVNVFALAVNVENLAFVGEGDFMGTGNGAANVLRGGDGDDLLRGRGGIDLLIGGLGGDTGDYTLAAAAVTARIDRQHATDDGDGAMDTYSSLEHLVGSNFNDILVGDAGANVLMGGVGRDILLGMDGDDILWGGQAGGDNQLQGGRGDDNQLQGGRGDDYYVLEAVDTVVELAGEGIDTVEARIAKYVLRENVERLIFTGTTKFTGTGNILDNLIVGGDKDDVLRGGGGNDTIHGGFGHDELVLRGAARDYAVVREGDGWRVSDAASGRDGSTYVTSIELLRFADGTTTALVYAEGTPTPTADWFL